MQIAGLFCDLEQLMPTLGNWKTPPNAFNVQQAALLWKGV